MPAMPPTPFPAGC